jgi:hypothetical protein
MTNPLPHSLLKPAGLVSKGITTEWFDYYIKPTYPGIYQVKRRKKGNVMFSFWTGNYWTCAGVTIEMALSTQYSLHKSLDQNKQWRGLANRYVE